MGFSEQTDPAFFDDGDATWEMMGIEYHWNNTLRVERKAEIRKYKKSCLN